jgi:hypothetical protein
LYSTGDVDETDDTGGDENSTIEEKKLKAQNLTESILGGKRNYELRLS